MLWASMTARTYDSLASVSARPRLDTYPLLELGQVGGAEGIGLGNNGNKVHSRAKPLHHFNVERLQRMTGRTDKVETSMDTEVDLVLPSRLLLLQHVRLMLVVEEFNDWHPGIPVVDIVTKARRVDNGQSDYPILSVGS